jgi:SAM-dependent methyltransferase
VKNAPYKMYHPRADVDALETHGQSWHDETVDENIVLCRYQFIEPLFREYLPKGGKILEAGCGLGRWVFYLRSLGYDVTGIDLAKEALELAKAYDPSAPIIARDILHTSFPDASFDAVISLGVVEHFEEGPQAAFHETLRLLKDGGLFFVTVPIQNLSRSLLANRLKELKRWLRKRLNVQYAFEEYRYTRRQFTALLEEAEFEILGTFPDDLLPPKNLGMYVDYPFLRHKARKWELNGIGHSLNTLLTKISPWATCAGALWICRKRR